MEWYNLTSFIGLFVIIIAAWLFSNSRKSINWRVVFWGLSLQLMFAVIIFWVPGVSTVFNWLNTIVIKILECGNAGAEFVFGRLALPPGTTDASGQESLGFFLAFQGLTAIIFFSAITSILYYYDILPWLIKKFAKVFSTLMRISGAESLCAASNIFVGVESALTVQPYIKKMTRSELCTILTCGMATVASNVLAVYVFFLRDSFPMIAAHLISASILSAPAALVIAKILYPETQKPVTMGEDIVFNYDKPESIYSAVIQGSQTGLQLVFNIAALLIAILGLAALADLGLTSLSEWLNSMFNTSMDLSLTGILGYVFYVPTLIIGVPWQDARHIAQIIGERSIVTELISYQNLAVLIEQNVLVHGRSVVIATYALCGFAHVASIGIFVGGVSALAPDRTQDIAKSGIRALIAATLACLMTACIAGSFYNESSLLFMIN